MKPTIPPQTPIPSQTPPPQPIATTPVKLNSPKSIILIIISLLALGTAVFFMYQNWQLKQQISQIKPTPTPIITPSLTPDPTVNWKTYTDPNGVYSFKYPQNYTLGHYATDNSPLLINNRIGWGITQHPAGGCMGDCPIITNTQDTIINNYSAKLYEGWVGSIGGETPQSYLKYEIKQPSANNYFVITLWELDRTSIAQKNYSQERKVGSIGEEDIKIFDQILSTFKFIDSTPEAMDNADYNGWTDFTDSILTFKYPEHWTNNGVSITGTSPSIHIVIVDNNSMMNECMEQTIVETKSRFVIRNFKRITTGEMCFGGSPTEAEVWIVKTKDSFGPGLQIRYSSGDQITTQILNNLISSFSFKN